MDMREICFLILAVVFMLSIFAMPAKIIKNKPADIDGYLTLGIIEILFFHVCLIFLYS